jgi:hypothetical protein
MNMQDTGTDQVTDTAAAGGDALSKIEALKTQIAGIVTALDDIATSVSGEEQPEGEVVAPEADVTTEAPVPEAAPAGKAPMFGKKKPQNDLAKGLGF